MPRGQLSKEIRLQIVVTKLKKRAAALLAEKDTLLGMLKERDARIKDLESKLKDKEAQRKKLLSYLYKPDTQSGEKKKLGKKQGAKGYQRPKPKDDEVTGERVYTLRHCPICRNLVGDALDTVVKYTEDIQLVPKKIITKSIITRHWCGTCDTFVKMSTPEILRIGLNVMAYVLYARYRLRLPINLIQQSLKDLHDFTISEGEIVNELHKAKNLFQSDYNAIIELIKNAAVVYADETGWRVEGQGWWMWVFSTDQGVRYVVEDTRGKGVAEDALGKNANRVLISDFYAAYKNLPGEKQKCWVHMLRDSKAGSSELHADLKEVYRSLVEELKKPKEERRLDEFRERLRLLAEKRYKEDAAQKLQERLRTYGDELLTCLRYDGVLPENNTAERAIRPMAVMRKIFGGSRSLEGAKTHEVNMSVIATKLKQNPDFFKMMLPLLAQRFQSGE